MNNTKLKKKKLAGTSLMELILVIAISSIIALAVTQVFLAAVKASGKNKEMQKNLEEGRSAMEIMAKNIRMSQYAADGGYGAPGLSLYLFNTSQNRCIGYRFDSIDKKLKTASCSPSYDSNGEPFENFYKLEDLVKNTDAKAIQTAAKKYFNSDNLVQVVLKPVAK